MSRTFGPAQPGLFDSETRNAEMRRDFEVFDKKHPKVWDLFVRFTMDRINRGYKHYSVNGIFERIRWETAEAITGTDQFKLNNNHRPFYARRFMLLFPRYDGFFYTRNQTSKKTNATGLRPLRPSQIGVISNG
mgnify:CR=1 FL=1|jgi:hypothetical protein